MQWTDENEKETPAGVRGGRFGLAVGPACEGTRHHEHTINGLRAQLRLGRGRGC